MQAVLIDPVWMLASIMQDSALLILCLKMKDIAAKHHLVYDDAHVIGELRQESASQLLVGPLLWF